MNNRTYIDLSNHFLISTSNVLDEIFSGTVIYIYKHNRYGATGLIINRLTEMKITTLFDRINLKYDVNAIRDIPIFFGGPIQTDRGFVLHVPANPYLSSIKIGQFYLTTSRDVLAEIALGYGPSKIIVTLGYTEWDSGQLEDELAQNFWLSVFSEPKIIFDIPSRQRYEQSIKLLGIEPVKLTNLFGHA